MEEVPFDSDRKLMSTKYSLNGVSTILTKESDEPLSVDTEYNFIFPGLISMVDPPRPESVEAVADAKKAGGLLLLLARFQKETHADNTKMPRHAQAARA